MFNYNTFIRARFQFAYGIQSSISSANDLNAQNSSTDDDKMQIVQEKEERIEVKALKMLEKKEIFEMPNKIPKQTANSSRTFFL